MALVVLLALVNLDWARSFVKENDGDFKLVGLAIAPILAVLGFIWGLADKAELKFLAKKLGEAIERARQADANATAAKQDAEQKISRINVLERDLESIANSGRLWKLRPNDPFKDYKGWKYDPIGAKIVTISLFKGGVGKTHLAANFAAYVSEARKKPVLLVDLDYQGSLSFQVMSAAGIEQLGSNVDALFDETADIASLSRKRVHLANSGPDVALNDGRGLSQAWIVPADYSLNEVESRLLVQRVVHNEAGLDERYRLAHVLLNPNVRQQYAMIIIDTPPRMTLGTVNAFIASHFFVVPSVLDRISSEAVKPFLTQVQAMKKDLSLDLELAGIVATMTRQLPLSAAETGIRDLINSTAREVLGLDHDPMIQQNIPRRAQITNQNDLGYFLSDSEGPLRTRFYDAVFDELWTRIMKP